jgi:hypothetical protein
VALASALVLRVGSVSCAPVRSCLLVLVDEAAESVTGVNAWRCFTAGLNLRALAPWLLSSLALVAMVVLLVAVRW